MVAQLVKEGDLKLGSVRHFVVDECDKVLDAMGERTFRLTAARLVCLQYSAGAFQHGFGDAHGADWGVAHADMRADVQEIFKNTPHDKQVMMFSATLSAEVRPVCKRFMSDVCPSPTRPPPLARCGRPSFPPSAFLPCVCQRRALHPLAGAQAGRLFAALPPQSCEGVALCHPAAWQRSCILASQPNGPAASALVH